ncbi:MAG: hypothetical protein LBB47_02335 [Spirochaetaceae bacterium]|nr:hypothetical protein [Spirochaetaceae bacterium]
MGKTPCAFNLRITRFRLNVAFSSGDAMATALLTKLLRGLAHCRPNFLPPRSFACKREITIVPRFLSRAGVCFGCDISVSFPAAAFLIAGMNST